MLLLRGLLSCSRRIVGLPLLSICVDALTQPVQRQRRLLRLALPTERIKALAQVVRLSSRHIEFVGALGQLLPVRGQLALQGGILTLQIGNLAP